MYLLIYLSKNHYEVSITITLNLKLRKLKHRKFKNLALVAVLTKSRAGRRSVLRACTLS